MTDSISDTLRKNILTMRKALSLPIQTSESQKICSQIKALSPYKKAKHIALYFAINNEVDLSKLWRDALRTGVVCYFPVINDDLTLSFLPATPDTPLKRNRFKIKEPDVSKDLALPINEFDLIMTPLVAFDKACTRLGMGAGYYDRTLAHRTKGILLGVAYPFQYVDHINPNPWDVPLDGVVTSNSIYWRRAP